jgi:hypothetical protein
MNASYLSNIDRDFLKFAVPKDVQETPGPGSYVNPDKDVTEAENPKTLEAREKDRERYAKNNPFGAGDPRFDYQKAKIGKDREGPTGDFNVHMAAVKDKEVLQKRQAIQRTLKFQK